MPLQQPRSVTLYLERLYGTDSQKDALPSTMVLTPSSLDSTILHILIHFALTLKSLQPHSVMLYLEALVHFFMNSRIKIRKMLRLKFCEDFFFKIGLE